MSRAKDGFSVKWRLVAVGAFLSLLVAAAGASYYLAEVDRLKSLASEDLAAIGELKARSLADWRGERITDALFWGSGGPAVELVARTEGSTQSGAENWLAWLADGHGVFSKAGRYHNVFVVQNGQIVASLLSHFIQLEPQTAELARSVESTGKPALGQIFRCGLCGEVHLDVAAPFLAPSGESQRVIVLRSDPETEFFPLVQTWPTPSPSAETLLAIRDGDEIVMLNRLRHSDSEPITIRFPLDRKDLPAVQAALGRTGDFEGKDYRGEEVLADLRTVPGSDWALVTKVDRNELMSEARFRGAVVLVGGLLLCITLWSLLVWSYGRRQKLVLAALIEAEKQKRDADEEIRTTLYGIGDGVIAVDNQGAVTRLNPAAEALTGWTESEARGHQIEEVFNIVNEDDRTVVECPVVRVLREGVVVGLANHTLLISKDGTQRPIADSGAPIRNADGEISGAVLVFHDQSAQRSAEKALRNESENLRAILAASPVAILVADENERIVMTNPAARTLFGPDSAGAEGRGCGDFLQCIHSAETTEGCGHSPCCPTCGLSESIRMVLSSNLGVHDREMEFWVGSDQERRRRFLRFSVESVYLAERHNVIVALYDVTEARQAIGHAEEARSQAKKLLDVAEQSRRSLLSLAEDQREAQLRLEESEQRVRSMFNATPDAVFVLDHSGRFLDTNLVAVQRYGYSREELLNMSAPDLSPDDRKARAAEKVRDSIRDNTPFEWTHKAKDGREIPEEISVKTFNMLGEPAILAVVRDITSRKKLEKEKENFEITVRQQQKLESIGTLASGVAHEINNPLNVIMNYGQLLLDDPQSTDQGREFAGNIVKECERVADIVRNLLQFSRRESEGGSRQALGEVVTRTVKLVGSLLRRDHIELTVELPPDLPSVRYRSQQIQQVILNLLTNARDSMVERPEEESARRISIRANVAFDRGADCLRLSVADSGCGIPEEVAQRIFDPFFTTKARDKGTGLGLSISYNIVKEHGGVLWFQSKRGEGTTFFVDLPLEPQG